MNHLRDVMESGRPSAGVFVTLMNTGIVEVFGSLAGAGLDWVLLDCQHFPVHPEHLATLLRTAEAAGVASLVRVGRDDRVTAGLALDLGAHGVVFPVVRSAAQARDLVDWCRYPPSGTRSVGGLRTHLRGPSPREPLCLINIEDRAGLEHLDEILAVEGIDAVFPGPVDLARSYGIPVDEAPDAELGRLLAEIESTATKHSVARMRYCATGAAAHEAFADGVQFAILGTDYGLLREQAEQVFAQALAKS